MPAAAGRTPIRKGYRDTDAGQIHFRYVDGSRARPLVFLHQTASSSQMWEAVMERLAREWPGRALYAFDTPGFGSSFDPAEPPSMRDYASWLLAAMRGESLERCHLVGHHTGAALALQIAADAPGSAITLTLIGPSLLTAEERQRFAERLGAPFRPGRSGAYLLKNWEYLRVGGADAEVALLHREMVDMLRAWSARSHAYAAVWDQDLTAQFKADRTPTLVMAAPDDIMHPQLKRARQLRPDVREVELSGGANFEPDLVPDEIAAALIQHVEQGEAGANPAADLR